MPMLKIANDLMMPESAVTHKFGVLAMSGAGKSNAAVVMAEEMFKAGLPFVVIDPKGDWWGLRSSGDGGTAGIPVPIFGGRHGDVPLDRGTGALIADLIVEKRLSCILDISNFDSENAKKSFLLDFARRIYQKNEEPLHLFLEEADDYIPQRPMRDEAYLLRAWENIVRRGRNRGLGITLITQRSACLNKNVLTQIETLIALRTTGPQDIDAIREWVRYHQQSADLLQSLPSLRDGEAWVWSPRFLQCMSRHQLRRRWTFDSGATPKNVRIGAQRKPATLADIDLSKIQAQMAATMARVKAEDPKELRKELAASMTQLSVLNAKIRVLESRPALKPERIEVSILTGNDRKLVERCEREIVNIARLLSRILIKTGAIPASPSRRDDASRFESERAALPTTMIVSASEAPTGQGISRMARTMLIVLAQHPDGLTKGQVLIHAEYRASGSVSATFAQLMANGLALVAGGRMIISPAGLRALGTYELLPTGNALLLHLLNGNKLSGMEKKILGCIADSYPGSKTKREILATTQYAASGSISAAFAKLVSLQYVVPAGRSELKLTDELVG